MRDLCRARTDAVNDQRRLRSQLKGFLLRHGYKYAGKSSWTEGHLRYLRELVLEHPVHRVLMEETLKSLTEVEERAARLTELIEPHYLVWERRDWCQALMSLRGFPAFSTRNGFGGSQDQCLMSDFAEERECA